jgi:two-component system chemotaxis response regulator CheY
MPNPSFIGNEPHLMVIDDDPDVLEAMQLALEMSGYRVETVNDGREALARLQGGSRPFLILLDLMMPHMSGLEFRAAQTGDPALAQIPVVVLSGDHARKAKSAAMGVEGLMKPIELEKLLATVHRFCPTT